MLRLLSISFVGVIVMIIVALALSSRSGEPDSAQSSLAARDASQQSATSTGEDTEVARDDSGKFHLAAVVNGEDARFLIDTGADVVALSVEDAERLGVAVDRDTFMPIAETASGTGNGAHIQIRLIEIAGQEFQDVDAIVIEGLGENLLGQSLLRKLGKLEVQGDKMFIRRS
jgi:aspartyl protease family protein